MFLIIKLTEPLFIIDFRVLAEEFDKRAELEKLQEELQDKWKAEQQKREGLEEFKEQQDRQLREEAERLEMLEEQRRKIDQDLQVCLLLFSSLLV